MDHRARWWVMIGLLAALMAAGLLGRQLWRRAEMGRAVPLAPGAEGVLRPTEPSPRAPLTRPPAATAPRMPRREDQPSLPAVAARHHEVEAIAHQASAPSLVAPAGPGSIPSDAGLRGLDRTSIRAAIHAVLPEIQACYHRWLGSSPTNQDRTLRIKADFTIVAKGGEGRIDEGEAIPYEEGSADPASLQDVTLRSCLLQSLTTARFPVPPGDGRVRVRYPFVMSAHQAPRR